MQYILPLMQMEVIYYIRRVYCVNNKVKHYRLLKDMTQQDLAEKLVQLAKHSV